MHFCCRLITKGGAPMFFFFRKKISKCAQGGPECPCIEMKWPLTLLRLIRFFRKQILVLTYPCQELLFIIIIKNKVNTL